MIAVCHDKGGGRVDNMWPKPGEKERSLKVCYVHKAKCDGKDIVVGCGVYEMTLEEVKNAISEQDIPGVEWHPDSMKEPSSTPGD